MKTRSIKHRRPDAGFTLVESMIAMALMAFIISQASMTSIYASHTNHYSRKLSRANMVANLAIEQSINTPYASLDVSPQTYNESVTNSDGTIGTETITESCGSAPTPDPFPCPTGATPCTAISNLYQYTRKRCIIPLDSAYATTTLTVSNMAEISVTVYWTDANGNTQSAKVSTMLSRF